MKRFVFSLAIFLFASIAICQADTKQQRVNFVLDQTKNIPWEANTGWLEIPNTGVRIRSYAFATKPIIKYQLPVIFTVEYDQNQVFAGNSFKITIKLKSTEPQKNTGLYLTGVYTPNSSYAVEARLGSEVKLQYDYQGETNDLYAPVDAAINIQKAFKTPLLNETQEARDSVPYLNLVPELNTSGLSLKAKAAYGALKLASPSLELFGGLKLEGKYVSGKVAATGASNLSENYFTFKSDGQEMAIWVHVHPQASLNSQVKINFSDLSYRFNLFKQMGMTLTVAGQKASTPQNVWEEVGEIIINGPSFSFDIPLVPGPPTSMVNPLPEKVHSLSFNVSWTGNSEARAYTIQYRIFKPASGYVPASWTNWQNWLVDTTATSAVFTVPLEGSEGNVYYFRSRAKNANNQWEPEHLQPDTHTRIALLFSISGRVKDNNNNPIPGATVSIAQNLTTTTDNAGNYTLSGVGPGNYTVHVTHPNWIFSPSFKSVKVDKNITNLDFTGSPPPPVSLADSRVNPLPNTQKTTTFTVSWSGTNAVAYDIQYKDGATGNWRDWVTNTTQTSKQFTGQNEHTYYFRSRAKDQKGVWEEYSNVPDTFTMISTSYGLRITEITPTSVKLQWDTPSSPVTRYEVHKTGIPDQYFGANSSTLYMNINNSSTTTCSVTGLQPNTKYYFIVAYVRDTVRDYSEIQSATTSGGVATSRVNALPAETLFPNLLTIPPGPPPRTFKVKWSGTNAVSYDIQYKCELSGQWTDWLLNTTAREADFPPAGVSLAGGKTYYFRSRARDQYGLWEEYPGADAGDAHTRIVISKAFTRILPLNNTQNSKTFTVSWDGMHTVAYHVQYRVGKNGNWVNWLTNTTLKSKEFTGSDGKTYFFRCRGKDEDGNWADFPPDELINTYTIVTLTDTQATSNAAKTGSSSGTTAEGVDLAVTSLVLTKREMAVEVTVRVKNNSKLGVDGCRLTIGADDGFQESREISLGANSTETIKFTWKPRTKGKCNVKVEIKPPDKIEDKNPGNNSLNKILYL